MKPNRNGKIILMIAVPILTLGIGILIGANMNNTISNNTIAADNIDSYSSPYTPDNVLSTPTVNTAQSCTLSAGTYTVGVDIQAGTYDVFLQSGSGDVLTENMQEIFGTGVDGYIQQYKNLHLVDGATLKITSDLTVKFDPK